MKIVQNPESGEIRFQLDKNEKYDMENHLDALIEFVCEQAVKTHKLINHYQELVKRLDRLDKVE